MVPAVGVDDLLGSSSLGAEAGIRRMHTNLTPALVLDLHNHVVRGQWRLRPSLIVFPVLSVMRR